MFVRIGSPLAPHNHPHQAQATLLDVLDAQSAAVAAVSFPAIVSETLKYLAVASGNPQMAAAFASSMASLAGVGHGAAAAGHGHHHHHAHSGPSVASLKNLERSLAATRDLNCMTPVLPHAAAYAAAGQNSFTRITHLQPSLSCKTCSLRTKENRHT